MNSKQEIESIASNNKKLIVHIATDEKFINSAYDIYEKAFPSQNKFLILVADESQQIKYLSKEKKYQFIYYSEVKEWIKNALNYIECAEYIIFHGMSLKQAEVALSVKTKAKLVWVVFGAEVYQNSLFFGKDIYGELTFKKYLGRSFLIKRKLRPLYHNLVKRRFFSDSIVAKALNKMDFCSVLYKEEFDLFKSKNVIRSDANWLMFTYYPLDIVINNEAEFINNNNILLGNSASHTNNHLEAFDMLKQIDLKEQKVICPLSYGNMNYSAEIKQLGESLFKDNFIGLTEFMPLKEYQKITQSCGIVIMNHYRQQAVGNVLDMMYRGAKVFLTQKNTLYHYLKRIGCSVFNTESDLIDGSSLLLLSKEEMIKNRELLLKEVTLGNTITQLRKKINV